MTIHYRPLGLFLSTWFLLALVFGYFELVRTLPFWAPPAIPLTLTLLVSLLVLKVPVFRDAIMRVDMVWLVSVGFLRALSFYIGYLAWAGEVPVSFAVPIETGVVIVMALAAGLIWRCRPLESRGRRWLVAWNVLGALQVVSILATVVWHILIGKPPTIFASLPMNLFPTFIVPLLFVSHIVIAYRLRRGPQQVSAG